MNQKKNTGLGPSLLLQRTTPPEATELAAETRSDVESTALDNVSDVKTSAPPEPDVDRAPAQRAQRGKPPKPTPDRCTIYLDREVNEMLSVAAGIKRMDRSALVNDILRTYLPTYEVTPR